MWRYKVGTRKAVLVVVLLSLIFSGCNLDAVPTPEKPPATATPAAGLKTPPTQAAGGTPMEVPLPVTETSPTLAPLKAITIAFVGGDPESLNPLYAYSWTAECVLDLTLASLWNIDEAGNYVMELAEVMPSFDNGGLSADGKVITYRLKPEAVWSDGVALTASDAVFTYEMIMDERNTPYSREPWETYVQSVRAVNEHTLQVKLKKAYADWSTSFFVGMERILPRHILEPALVSAGTLDNAAWNSLPEVGSGPFVVAEYVPASHVTLKANPLYWRGRPKLDEVRIRLMEDNTSQLAALASGEVDVGAYIDGFDIFEIEKLENLAIYTAENGYQVTLFLNLDPKTTHPALTDERVRRAIALAIDRQRLVRNLYDGLFPIPVTYWHGSVYENPDLEPYPFDPEQARSLLEEAGWVDSNDDGVREKGKQRLVLRYARLSNEKVSESTLVFIQQMLFAVGIGVRFMPTTAEALWGSYKDGGLLAWGEYDLVYWSDGLWSFPSPDTSYFLCTQIPSSTNPWGYNWFGICDPTLDKLFTQQAVEINPQKRIEIVRQIGKIMYDQTMIIPLYADPDIWAVNTRLSNVRFSGVDPLMYVFEWDLK
ncbi:MAG: peptide ABC transporter substrate-binding protein [Chloroflexota bacterium]